MARSLHEIGIAIRAKKRLFHISVFRRTLNSIIDTEYRENGEAIRTNPRTRRKSRKSAESLFTNLIQRGVF